MRPLDATTVAVPDLPITILQFGTGNFLRSFADQMIQKANDAGLTRHGIALVRTTTGPSASIEALRGQDGLYHTVLEGMRDGILVREHTLVTAVREILDANIDFAPYRARYLSPDLQVIISNTTEAGITWVTGDDLDARPPVSFPAKIAALLRDRYEYFDGAPGAGLHIVCCELIEDNATVLRELVLRHAEAAGLAEGFSEWVRSDCFFHDSLVDRIVPGFPAEEIGQIQAEVGFADECVVKGEYFGLWAIAGDPALRRILPLDRAGQPVVFVDDLASIRSRKVRILNGLHTAMASVGLSLGLETVYEAALDPRTARYLRRMLETEILPSFTEEQHELVAFADAIVERFANPSLHHRLADIALNSLAKWQARTLPVVVAAWDAGRDAPGATFGLAALMDLYCAGSPPFAPRDDPQAITALRDALTRPDRQEAVRGFVVGVGYFSADDADADRLATDLVAHIAAIERDGLAAALERVVLRMPHDRAGVRA